MKKKIPVNYNNIDFEVTGNYYPKLKGCMYLSNGDPGHPEEPACIDDIDILHEGVSIYDVLSEYAIDHIYDLALEKMEDI